MDPNTPNQGQPPQQGFPPYGSPPPDPTSDRPFSAPPPVTGQPASGSPAYPPPGQPGQFGSPQPSPGAGQPGQFGAQPGQVGPPPGQFGGQPGQPGQFGAQPGHFGPQPGQFGGQPPQKKGSSGVVIGVVVAVVALLLVCGGIGVGAFVYFRGGDTDAGNISTSTDYDIQGLINYREKNPSVLTQNHQPGRVTYPMSPPAGGDHYGTWQNCQGDVYTAEIPKERAVHSLEHGAVWVTYRPGLPSEQITALANKVRGNDYMLMSPYPGLDQPISLQAWGYQVKVSNADDANIDRFITSYRRTATKEPSAPCSNGWSGTGTDPAVP